jgi:hypothetical protein
MGDNELSESDELSGNLRIALGAGNESDAEEDSFEDEAASEDKDSVASEEEAGVGPKDEDAVASEDEAWDVYAEEDTPGIISMSSPGSRSLTCLGDDGRIRFTSFSNMPDY